MNREFSFWIKDLIFFIDLLLSVMKLMNKYISADIFISCLQCSQTIPVVEQMFGLTLVAVVTYFAQLDRIVQQPQKEFLAVVGIILLQNFMTILYQIWVLEGTVLIYPLEAFSSYLIKYCIK